MTNKTRPSFFRRKFLVHPKFQLTMLCYMILFSVIVTAVMLFSIKLYFDKAVLEGVAFGHQPGDYYFIYLYDQYLKLSWTISGASISCTIFLLIGSVLLSHRIVGPLMRLKQELINMGKSGVFKPVQFREKDFFKDLAETFNVGIQKLLEKNKR